MEKGFPAKKVKMILAAFVGSLVALYSARTSARNMDWKDGVKLWSVTAVSSPGSYRAYYNLGMSYEYERGDTEKAVEAFKKSLERYDLPATHNALGMVYLRNKRYQEALTEFIRANKGDPGLGSVYCHLGQLYLETGDPDKAIEILEKGFMDAREEFPYYDPIPRADMRAILGKAFFEKKDHKRAISELKASLAIRPGDVDVCYCLGRCYASEGMLKDSEKIFIQALRSDPGNVAIRYALANVYLRSKEFDKAEKEYLRILDIEPDYSDARNNLANIYYARGMVDMAVKEYNRVLEADPSHFKARNNLANVCLMNRDFDKAIVEYRRILDGRNSSAVVHFNLGLAYEGKGMLTKAYDEWMAALNIDPDFVPAEEALKRIGAKKGK
ncbi:MAG: tetratricopeptide repeat protein [Candidatus Omnitrophica bacterium]|nr:tetratricopeptide repeat protein [Candidatus Omnitrophota bacterium]